MSRPRTSRTTSIKGGSGGAFRIVVTAAVALFVAGVLAVVLIARQAENAASAPPAGASAAGVAKGARLLSASSGAKVQVVEFLDFECEACGAVYPTVESLRKQYGDRVQFAYRYFPIPSHFNSTNAARAVEAAQRQGKAEAMYNWMYQNQTSWSEQQTSKAAVFRDAAKQIGLDLQRYDADVASASVANRVKSDYALGGKVGVQGTPTFFVNGTRVDLQQVTDLKTAIDAALAA